MTAWRAAVVLVVACAAARADVLKVPAEFETIQAAIDAAVAGDEIAISAGTYAEALVVSAKSDLLIRGQGKVVIDGTGAADETHVRLLGSTDITLERLTVPSPTLHGIAIDDSVGTVVFKCRVSAAVGAGISAQNSSDVLIERVRIEGSDGNGLIWQGGDRLTLRRCLFQGGDDPSVNILDGAGHIVERVTIREAGSSALNLGFDVSGAIVRRCVIVGPTSEGLISVASSTLIEDNRLVEAGDFALFLGGGDGCILRNNRILRGASGALLVTAGAHQLLDNRATKPGQEALFVVDSPGQLIAGNRITGALDDGIVVSNSDGCTLVDNRVTSSAANGIILDANGTQVAGNRVSGSAEAGFAVLGTGNLLTGNKAKGSDTFDLSDTSGFGNTYVDNDFGTTHFE
jgi:parallel beta-helix repeat protein